MPNGSILELLRKQGEKREPEPEPMPELPPAWGLEERTWDLPFTLETPTGERIDAFVRPDNTVWMGKELIGSIDPKTGEFEDRPPTTWESIGAGLGQAGLWGLKGLEYFFKPFELFHEYAAKPFSIAVTSPWWQETWWEEKTPEEQRELEAAGFKKGKIAAESPWEFVKAFMPGGEFREAYEQWEAPKYLRGTIEFVPWLIIPSFGAVGGALSGLGRGGRIATQVLKPYIWTEQLAGAALRLPFRGAKAVSQFVMKKGKIAGAKEPARYVLKEGKMVDEGVKFDLPERIDMTGYRNEIRRVYPERVKASTEEATMVLDAFNYDLAGQSFAKSASTSVTESILGKEGDDIALLGLKRIGAKHVDCLITNPNVKPKVAGESMAWGDVFSAPHKYDFIGEQGQRILAMAKNYHQLEAQNLAWARKAGIPIKELRFTDPETRYIGRMAVAKVMGVDDVAFDVKGRVIIERVPRPLKRKAVPEYERVYEQMIDGRTGNMLYAPPILAMRYRMSQIFYRGHRLEAVTLVKGLGKTESERMADGIRESLEFWRGSKKDLQFLKAVMNRIARGERPAPASLQKIDRIYPSLGARVREILRARPTHEAAATEIAQAEILGMELQPILTQLTGLEEQLMTEPARRFIDIVAKVGMYKGEIASLTKTQYRILTGARWVTQKAETPKGKKVKVLMGGQEPTKGMLTPDGKRVRWEYALDTIATEQGYPSGDAFKVAIERASAIKQEIDLLKSQVAAMHPEWTTAKGAVAARVAALNQARRQAIRDLMPIVDTSLKGVEREVEGAAGLLTVAKKRAGRASFTEGAVVDIPELHSRIFPTIFDAETGKVLLTAQQLTKLISQKLGVDTAPKAMRVASDVNRMAVSQMATLDASWWAIQGMRTLGHDTRMWAAGTPSTKFYKTMIQGLKAFANPGRFQHFRQQHLATYLEYPMMPTMSHDIVVGMGIMERWARKVPVMGNRLGALINQTYGRAQAMFNSAAETSRVLMVEGMEAKWLAHGGTKLELLDYACMTSGVVDMTRLGLPVWRQLSESLSLFSPSFTRSWLMSFRHLFRGNLTAREVEKDLAGMVAAMVTGYVTLSAMIGQEPKLNPAPKSLGGDGAEFLSFTKDGAVIGLPGWGYSVLRLLGAVSAAAREKPDSLIKFSMENPTLRFVMSRSSPLLGLAKEIATQRDFIGRRIDEPGDWAHALATKVTPIAMQSILLEEQMGTGKFYAFGAELFGMRTYPKSEWEKLKDLRDEYSSKEFNKAFDDLNLEQKDYLMEQYPDYRELKEEAGEKFVLESGKDWDIWLWATRKQADATFHGQVEDAARSLTAGAIDMKTYVDYRRHLKDKYKGSKFALRLISAQANPDDVKQFQRWLEEEQKPEDKALSKYWDIIGSPKTDPETGLPDWDATEQQAQSELDKLDPETRDYVLRNKDRWTRNLPPTAQKIEQMLSAGRVKVDEYYNLPEGKARTQYRKANPTVDAWLLVMGRVTRPQSSQAMQIALRLLREHGLPETILVGAQAKAVTGGPILSLLRR